MVVPVDANLKWLDDASELQHFPNEDVDGVTKPQFPAFLVYKKADGTFAWSTLDTLLTSLLTELQLKADLTETQPVSLASVPLPSGAATAANQQTDAITDAELRASPVPVSGTVTSTPSGTQNVDVVANTIGLATQTTLAAVLTELQLKADLTETQPVSVASFPASQVVTDDLASVVGLADQVGADAVLTFTFPSTVNLAWVRSVGGVSRALDGAQTPTATTGAYCADDEPAPITFTGTVLKVYAPTGATVSVWGYAR